MTCNTSVIILGTTIISFQFLALFVKGLMFQMISGIPKVFSTCSMKLNSSSP